MSGIADLRIWAYRPLQASLKYDWDKLPPMAQILPPLNCQDSQVYSLGV